MHMTATAPRRDWESDQLLLFGLKGWKVQEEEQEGYTLDQSEWWTCETIEGKRESTFLRASGRPRQPMFLIKILTYLGIFLLTFGAIICYI
jgi:hypothetical protein